MSTIYTVRIIHVENIRSWAANKVGLVFDALMVKHHNSFEGRMIFLGVKPEHGWIYEDEARIIAQTKGRMVKMMINPPRLPIPQFALE